ncbi:4-alpha-glucanotransferase [Escherichia coli]
MKYANWLHRDLAVGVAEGGGTWCDRELYCLKASVAPPDILGPLGRSWGLPPMDRISFHACL